MCWIKLAYLAPTVNYSPRQFGYSSQYIYSTATILFFSYKSNYQNSVDVSSQPSLYKAAHTTDTFTMQGLHYIAPAVLDKAPS